MTAPGRLFDPDDVEPEPVADPVPPGSVAVSVVPDVSGLDREFDYVAGSEQAERLAVGSLVKVELNHRLVEGWVSGVGIEPAAGVDLRPIVKVLSVGPSAELIGLARWAAWRWSGRLAAVLKTASPPRRVSTLPASRAPAPAGTAARHGATVDAQLGAAFGSPGVVVARLGPNADVLPWLLAAGSRGSAVVVVPRLAVARHLAGRLRQRGVPARLYPNDWAAAAGRGGVVLGARSAVWARVADLGSVVVVDEHDEALQEERNPTWHARDVAIERASRAGVPCVLLSPCPSLAALSVADRQLAPVRDEERASWPLVEVVDRRDEEPGRGGLFSARVAELVRGTGTVLAVLNRKGRAIMLACGTCGELVRTEDGEQLMVERDGELVSPATGETRPLVCAACGGTALRRLRLGVTRAAEELAALAGEPVGELTGAARGDRPPDSRVMVGTEAALHQLRAVDAVAFLDFDQELLAPRYRAAEQAMALLVLAARLVGPRGGGRVVVQTRSPGHRVLQAALRADPGRFVAAEQELRQAMSYPPFAALAEISGAGAAQLAGALGARPPISVLGPRHDGRYLVRAPSPAVLADELSSAPRPEGRVRVAVDPPRA